MKIIFYVIILTIALEGSCLASAVPKKNIIRGTALYNNGRFDDSLKEYEKALAVLPDSDIVNFDLGASLYKTDDYKRAVSHFEKALVSDDPLLAQKANYNLGNAEYKFGISKEEENLNQAISLLESALRHYTGAIALDEKDDDAKYNYEFVKKELERLRMKLEQQKQEQQEKEREQKTEEREQKEQSGEGQEEQKQQQDQQGQQQDQEQNPEEGNQQQDKQNQQDQQRDKDTDEQKPKEGNQKPKEHGKQPQSGSGEKQKAPGEMTEQDAKMILENYRYEEEPKSLYKEKIDIGGLSEPEKDW